MKYNKEIRDEILASIEQREVLKQRIETLTKELQESCDHASVAECPAYTILSYFPPQRICIQCGLEETRYYAKLKAQPVRIIEDSHDFWKLRTLRPLVEVAVPG